MSYPEELVLSEGKARNTVNTGAVLEPLEDAVGELHTSIVSYVLRSALTLALHRVPCLTQVKCGQVVHQGKPLAIVDDIKLLVLVHLVQLVLCL